MPRFKLGVQLHPQHTTIEELRRAWRACDRLGVDSIWVWDHFYPLYGNGRGAHFECWSMLAAMAVETSQAQIGALVSCVGYRNPDLLADMARTVDHLSGGRLVLGLGAGWLQRDYVEYGYTFGTPASRLQELARALPRIKQRLARLNPPPVGALPILIGGGGERVTLRLVAEHAQMWHTFGAADSFAHKSAVLDQWCARVGRDPASIERAASVSGAGQAVTSLLRAGAQHLIVGLGTPFDVGPVRQLLDLRG